MIKRSRTKSLTFNITYHPVFGDVRNISEELRVILTSDDGHKKVNVSLVNDSVANRCVLT